MKKWFSGLLAVSIILLLPTVARADGVAPEFIIFFGCGILLPLGLFLTFVEGAVISRYLKIGFWETCRFTFTANLVSAIAGIPVLALNQWLFEKLMPKELHLYFKYYLPVSLLIFLIYFLVSVFLEFICGLVWRIRRKGVFTVRSLEIAIVLANIVTYGVLAPVDYFAGYPKTNIRKYTPATEWAKKPPVKIIYLDNETKYLMQIDSDGSNGKVLVPFPVWDYMFSSDLDTYVYIGMDNKLYWYRRTTEKKVEITQASVQSMMYADLSPSGNKVAYLSTKENTIGLILVDTVTGKRLEYANSVDAKADKRSLAWSKDERILYLWEGRYSYLSGQQELKGKFTRIVITDDFRIKKETLEEEQPQFADNYGRFWFDPYDMVDIDLGRGYDVEGNTRIQTRDSYWGRHFLRIERSGRQVITFSNRSGIFFRFYGGSDPSVIQMGKECIFELDNSKIYLIDVDSKMLGKITNGHDHVVMTDSYTKKKFFDNLKRKDRYFFRSQTQ